MSFEMANCNSKKLVERTTQVAQILHHCHCCPYPIYPGDLYHREVWLVKMTGITETDKKDIIKFGKKNRITVYKEHYICPDDRYDEEEEVPIVDDIPHQKEVSNNNVSNIA